MQNLQTTSLSDAISIKFCESYSLSHILKKIFLISIVMNVNVAMAENPYQEALKQQRILEREQRQPVDPFSIPPSQLELERNLEQESALQQQKILKLQTEINRLKRKRDQEREDNE